MEESTVVETETGSEVFTATIKLRKATPEDLKKNSTELKYGYPYWLRSTKTGKFDQRTYFLAEHTDPYDLAMYLNLGMIYVPVNWEDENNAI